MCHFGLVFGSLVLVGLPDPWRTAKIRPIPIPACRLLPLGLLVVLQVLVLLRALQVVARFSLA